MRSKASLAVPTLPQVPRWADDPEEALRQIEFFVEELKEWCAAFSAALDIAMRDNATDHQELDERVRGLGG